MHNIYGQRGQGCRNLSDTFKHKPSFTIEEVKTLNPARWYYPRMLEGRFGKLSCNSWCAWQGLCPFHSDRKPGSVFINLATGAYKCFSCGAGAGDVLAFHGKLKKITFREALLELGGGQ